MVLGGLLANEGAGGQCVGVVSSCSPEAGASGVAGGLRGGPWGGRGLVMWQGACGVAGLFFLVIFQHFVSRSAPS